MRAVSALCQANGGSSLVACVLLKHEEMVALSQCQKVVNEKSFVFIRVIDMTIVVS
jgi:hypothetical protein